MFIVSFNLLCLTAIQANQFSFISKQADLSYDTAVIEGSPTFQFKKSLAQPRGLGLYAFDLEVQRIIDTRQTQGLKSVQVRVAQKGEPDRVVNFPVLESLGKAFQKANEQKVSMTEKFNFVVKVPRSLFKDLENLEITVEAWEQACFEERLDCSFLTVIGSQKENLGKLLD